jgi:tetratricopeptide (TPR) repeat protein
MGGKRKPAGPRWIGCLLFVVMVTGLLLFQHFHKDAPSERAALTVSALVYGWIVLLLILFALIVICAGIYVWLTRDPLVFKAYRMERNGRGDAALEMLRQKVAERPKAVRAAAMGWILNQADRHAEAADAFALAESLEPKTVMFSVERAVAMAKNGQGDAALAHLQRLGDARPEEGGYPLAAAAVLDELGRPAEARGQFRLAEELLQKFPKAYHAQRTIAALRSRLAQRLGRDSAQGLTAELHRAFGQRASSPATIKDDGANNP